MSNIFLIDTLSTQPYNFNQKRTLYLALVELVMESKISVMKFGGIGRHPQYDAQLIECYRDVFADSPWHEWLKCPKCEMYWGKKDHVTLLESKFEHCGSPLVDFWPRKDVLEDLTHELSSGSSSWLALDQEKDTVIGFCWGYPMIISHLEDKLGIMFPEQWKSGREGLIAYQDDVGVLSEYRGQKIAKRMIINRLQDFLAQGLGTGLVRTRKSPEPSTTYLWYTEKLGYDTIASYPDGRVILARSFDGLLDKLQ